MKIRLSLVLLTVGASIGASACATAKMTVPPEVATNADVVSATDRSSASGAFVDESFTLGKLAIDDVDRDWDSTSSLGVLSFSKEKTSGGYSYTVKSKGLALNGGCVTEGSAKSFGLGSGMSIGKQTAKLGCTCKGGEGEPTSVVIEASTTSEYGGTLKTADSAYKVTAIYEAEGMISNGQPTGYRLDGEDGASRGAVEVLKPGRIWFPKDMDDVERDQLACLYIGLMLYMPPDE